MSTNKKILIGAGILTLIIVIVGFVLVLSHKKTVVVTNSPSGSPFGTGGTGGSTLNTSVGALDVTGVGAQVKTVGQLSEISATPVSGATFVSQSATTSARSVAFIERATGHLFAADLGSGAITRLTNDTLPKIQKVVWGNGGINALVQSLEDGSGAIDTSFIQATHILSATSTATSTNTGTSPTLLPLQTFELQPNILALAISPKGDQIFYMLHSLLGGTAFVSDEKGDNAVAVAQFGTDEWNAAWGSANVVYLTSKPSNGSAGFLYSINIKNKTTTLLIGNVLGLSTLPSPLGDKILYTSIIGSNTKMYIYDVKSNTSSVPLDIATLVEKCAWTQDESAAYCGVPRTLSGDAPDDWYQGTASFGDDIWRVNLNNGSVTKVATLTTSADASGGTIDVVNPVVSTDGNTMIFMNKKDLSLWAVNLNK